MDEESRPVTLSPSQASNPGRLRVNYLRWFIHKPTWPLIWAGAVVACLLGAIFHWSLLIPAGLLLVWNLLYWMRVRDHFTSGDANPGLVVSVDPLLIAVATDMTKGLGTYPAVKVFKGKLRFIDGQLPQVGMRLATIALYSPSMDQNLPHWADFDPHPAQYATDNPVMISALMESFTADDWRRLEQLLKQVPQPYKTGLYMIKPESKP